MSEINQTSNDPDTETPSPQPGRSRLLVAIAVFVLFAIIIGARLLDSPQLQRGPSNIITGEVPTGPDPVSTLDTALAASEPVFVLFHSSACAPCVEMEAVVARVFPEYRDAVTYVDAATDDGRTRPLFERFAFQYIPTSIFIGADGQIVDQVTGVLTDGELRSRLDALLSVAE